jgi:hypothetical protein
MPAVPMGTIDAAVQGRLPNPNVRVGPFWFGMEGGVDGFLLVERIR